jgi:hypothetical protein
MTRKQEAIDRTKPITTTPGRYQPTDACSSSSTAPRHADAETAIILSDNIFHRSSA